MCPLFRGSTTDQQQDIPTTPIGPPTKSCTYHDLLGNPVGLHQLGRPEELEVEMAVVRVAVHTIVVGEAHAPHLTPHRTLGGGWVGGVSERMNITQL